MKTITLQLTDECFELLKEKATSKNLSLEVWLTRKLLKETGQADVVQDSKPDLPMFKDGKSGALTTVGKQYLISLFEQGLGPTAAAKQMPGISQQLASYHYSNWHG